METDKSIVMVVAQKDFQSDEYAIPRQIFEQAGFGVRVASSQSGECYGSSGETIYADLNFDGINVEDFDAVVFVGGPGTEELIKDSGAAEIAKVFSEQNKLVSAICWAPSVLARAGIIKGKRITAWGESKADIEAAGGIFTGEKITVDGLIVTANGPSSAGDFAQKVVNLLSD